MNNQKSMAEMIIAHAINDYDHKPEKVAKFFKTKPGEYAEKDKFLGLTSPNLTAIVKQYPSVSSSSIIELLHSPYNEMRLLGLMFMKRSYQTFAKKRDHLGMKNTYQLYLNQRKHVNNWNLVDNSAPHIVGHWLLTHSDEKIIWHLAKEKIQWSRRIAVISQLTLVRHQKTKTAYALCQDLMNDPEDLMHKACGWVLRECGKINENELEYFLKKHIQKIPRVTLRYAIERMDEKKRKALLTLK